MEQRHVSTAHDVGDELFVNVSLYIIECYRVLLGRIKSDFFREGFINKSLLGGLLSWPMIQFHALYLWRTSEKCFLS